MFAQIGSSVELLRDNQSLSKGEKKKMFNQINICEMPFLFFFMKKTEHWKHLFHLTYFYQNPLTSK